MTPTADELQQRQQQLLSTDSAESLQALQWLAQSRDQALLLYFYLPLAVCAHLQPDDATRRQALDLLTQTHGSDWAQAQAHALRAVYLLEDPNIWQVWQDEPQQFRHLLLSSAADLLASDVDYLPLLASSAHYRALLLNLAGNFSLLLQADEEAEQLLRALLPHAPQDAELHYRLARILHHVRRYDEARAFYENTLALQPQHLYALESIAQLIHAHYADELQMAILYAQRAIAVEPFSAPLYHLLADCHYREQEYERAFQFIEIALSINEHYPPALSLLARYHLHVKNDPQAALEIYLKGLDHPTHGHNALLLEEAGDLYAHSLQDYAKARLC